MPASKYDEAEEKIKNRWKKEPSNATNSTLSLHIAAYENSVEGFRNAFDKNEGFKKEGLVEKWKNVKHIFAESLQSLIQNPFEFPRQQEEGQVRESKVMQFKTSQRLLNQKDLNKPQGGSGGPLPKVMRMSSDAQNEYESDGDGDEVDADVQNEVIAESVFSFEDLLPTSSDGIWTTTANTPITRNYKKYIDIIDLATQYPQNISNADPKIHSSPGTILVYEVAKILTAYPQLKNVDDARKNIKADGYSYGDPLRTSAIGELGKRTKTNALDPQKNEVNFSRIEVWTSTHILLHYTGDNSFASKSGVKHGNASFKTNPYVRSTKSNIEMQKAQLKPLNSTAEEVNARLKNAAFMGPENLKPVQLPRDLKQTQNCRTAAIQRRRLGPNSIDNLAVLYHYLNYPNIGKNLHFIFKANVAGNITVELHCHDALSALAEVLKIDGKQRRQRIYYDTTFLFGDTYLSIITWLNPATGNLMILGAFLHNRKFHSDHLRFFKNFYDENEGILKAGFFILITDDEFSLDFAWPNLRQLLCSIHILRNLKANFSSANKDAAVISFLELKYCRTFKQFDDAKLQFLQSHDFNNDRDIELYERYTSKLRQFASIPALARYDVQLLDGVDENDYVFAPCDNSAESMNAKLRRLFHGESPVDLLVVKIHHLSVSLYTDFNNARYGRGSWQLKDEYISLKKGGLFDVPKSEILELPNPEDYASNIKEKRKVILNGPEISVDVFDGEENYARKFVAATIINSCSITNLGNGKFWVEDSKGSFAVEKRDRNVLKCQCNTAKSCVHIGAVKLLSGEEATFGRAQDPVKTNNAFLQKYETKSGRKRPRLIDTPAAAAAEVEESGDDEREMASVDHSLEDWLKNGKVVAEKDSVLSSPSAVEKKVQERDNIRSMFCESLTNVKRMASFTLHEESYPEWFMQILEANVHVSVKGVLRNTFQHPIPIVKPGDFCLFKTSDNILMLVQREKDDSVKGMIIHNIEQDVFMNAGNGLEECFWASSFCARNCKKVFVQLAYQQSSSPIWTAALLLELITSTKKWGSITCPEEDPSNFNAISKDIVLQSKIKFKQRTLEMYCCCNRPHLKARSSDRSKRLEHSELLQCGSCATWNYAVCHGVELNNNKESWYCSDCRQLPILPAWGPIEHFSNTCPIDNYVAIIFIYKNLLKRTIDEGDAPLTVFENAILTFLNTDVNSMESITAAKVELLQSAFPNFAEDNDLYGSECTMMDSLYTGGRVTVETVCDSCNNKSTDSDFYKLSIGNFDETTDNVNDFISRRLHLSSISIRETCCNKILRSGEATFIAEKPWMLLLSPLSPSELKTFTLAHLLSLPLSVEQTDVGEIYILAGITFHIPTVGGHFVSLIRYGSNWLFYDGLDGARNSYFATLPNILKNLVNMNPLLGNIIYLRK